jgi:hypothetical protein
MSFVHRFARTGPSQMAWAAGAVHAETPNWDAGHGAIEFIDGERGERLVFPCAGGAARPPQRQRLAAELGFLRLSTDPDLRLCGIGLQIAAFHLPSGELRTLATTTHAAGPQPALTIRAGVIQAQRVGIAGRRGQRAQLTGREVKGGDLQADST